MIYIFIAIIFFILGYAVAVLMFTSSSAEIARENFELKGIIDKQVEEMKKLEASERENAQVDALVSLPVYICGKCRKEMKYWDGCSMGTYGVDIENCEDPQYGCECGNKFYIEERSS